MEREKTVNTSELILSNLRHNLRRVEVHVLGKDYYNLGSDVYKADELMCDDLIEAYEDQKKENRVLTFLMLVMFFMVIVLLYMGVNHLWVF
jgi:hypothetical protein